jgi:hypothetical protein
MVCMPAGALSALRLASNQLSNFYAIGAMAAVCILITNSS